MSTFKDSGIILKIQKQNSKELLYTIFSLKFGKILASNNLSKNKKALDLGYHINYEIKTKPKNNINKIGNIKIINEFNLQNKNFKELNNYLELINLILKKTEFGIENSQIFEIINLINKYNKSDIYEKIILAKLKFLHLNGELNINNKNEVILKILKFISKNNFNKIIKLTGLNDKLIKELQNLII